jgi:hypothetical protein
MPLKATGVWSICEMIYFSRKVAKKNLWKEPIEIFPRINLSTNSGLIKHRDLEFKRHGGFLYKYPAHSLRSYFSAVKK